MEHTNDTFSLRAVRTGLSKDTEGQYLKSILSETNGNVSKAAVIAGVHRTHLYKLLHQYDIDPADYRVG